MPDDRGDEDRRLPCRRPQPLRGAGRAEPATSFVGALRAADAALHRSVRRHPGGALELRQRPPFVVRRRGDEPPHHDDVRAVGGPRARAGAHLDARVARRDGVLDPRRRDRGVRVGDRRDAAAAARATRAGRAARPAGDAANGDRRPSRERGPPRGDAAAVVPPRCALDRARVRGRAPRSGLGDRGERSPGAHGPARHTRGRLPGADDSIRRSSSLRWSRRYLCRRRRTTRPRWRRLRTTEVVASTASLATAGAPTAGSSAPRCGAARRCRRAS